MTASGMGPEPRRVHVPPHLCAVGLGRRARAGSETATPDRKARRSRWGFCSAASSRPSNDATSASARGALCSLPPAVRMPSTTPTSRLRQASSTRRPPGCAAPPATARACARISSRSSSQRTNRARVQRDAPGPRRRRTRSARRRSVDVGGERRGDVLGQGELQRLPGAQVRRAAALGQARPAVDGTVGEPAAAPRRRPRAGPPSSSSRRAGVSAGAGRARCDGRARRTESTRGLASAGGQAYLLQT